MPSSQHRFSLEEHQADEVASPARLDDRAARTVPDDVRRHLDRVYPGATDALSREHFAGESDGLNERIFRFERCAQSGVFPGV
jgi:hypothetical protein